MSGLEFIRLYPFSYNSCYCLLLLASVSTQRRTVHTGSVYISLSRPLWKPQLFFKKIQCSHSERRHVACRHFVLDAVCWRFRFISVQIERPLVSRRRVWSFRWLVAERKKKILDFTEKYLKKKKKYSEGYKSLQFLQSFSHPPWAKWPGESTAAGAHIGSNTAAAVETLLLTLGWETTKSTEQQTIGGEYERGSRGCDGLFQSFLAFGFWSLAGILTDLAQHSLPPGGAVACVGTDTLTSV